jgi:hypothetical protein
MTIIFCTNFFPCKVAFEILDPHDVLHIAHLQMGAVAFDSKRLMSHDYQYS